MSFQLRPKFGDEMMKAIRERMDEKQKPDCYHTRKTWVAGLWRCKDCDKSFIKKDEK